MKVKLETRVRGRAALRVRGRAGAGPVRRASDRDRRMRLWIWLRWQRGPSPRPCVCPGCSGERSDVARSHRSEVTTGVLDRSPKNSSGTCPAPPGGVSCPSPTSPRHTHHVRGRPGPLSLLPACPGAPGPLGLHPVHLCNPSSWLGHWPQHARGPLTGTGAPQQLLASGSPRPDPFTALAQWPSQNVIAWAA